MNTVTLDGWCKPDAAANPIHIELIHFRVSEEDHRRLEEAEEELQRTQEREKFVAVEMKNLELKTSDQCGPLKDCQLRVYLSPIDRRGHFHLVTHRVSDDSLVYTNAVMVDQLG